MARKANAAFMKPLQPSDELAEIVGDKPLPRTQVTKKVWAYIKRKKLQAKKDKRTILPEGTKLEGVLGSKPINMFKMTAKIAKHLS